MTPLRESPHALRTVAPAVRFCLNGSPDCTMPEPMTRIDAAITRIDAALTRIAAADAPTQPEEVAELRALQIDIAEKLDRTIARLERVIGEE